MHLLNGPSLFLSEAGFLVKMEALALHVFWRPGSLVIRLMILVVLVIRLCK